MESIAILVEQIPVLFMYIVPGYLVLWIMGFMFSRDLNKDTNLILKSIVLSYLLITAGNCFGDISAPIPRIVIILIAVAVGFILSKAILSDNFIKILRWLGIKKSVRGNIFNDIIDVELGLWATVFIPNDKTIIKGMIKRYEEREDTNNSYLILSNYKQFSYTNKGTPIIDHAKENRFQIMINTRDISRMELYYHPESQKIV